MISVIFCSRTQDNPDSNLKKLLDSAADQATKASNGSTRAGGATRTPAGSAADA